MNSCTYLQFLFKVTLKLNSYVSIAIQEKLYSNIFPKTSCSNEFQNTSRFSFHYDIT